MTWVLPLNSDSKCKLIYFNFSLKKLSFKGMCHFATIFNKFNCFNSVYDKLTDQTAEKGRGGYLFAWFDWYAPPIWAHSWRAFWIIACGSWLISIFVSNSAICSANYMCLPLLYPVTSLSFWRSLCLQHRCTALQQQLSLVLHLLV